jgi:undecaprenyl-phosphate 4-deoxy-4-formamido-L-arabinose transferase
VANGIALSIVIPVYNGATTIGKLVEEISRIDIPGRLEIVLVNDGSPDDSGDVCRRLTEEATIPVILVEHARNFGEHNAVMTGLRHARGDLQNPPHEIKRLFETTRDSRSDVVYTYYEEKRHSLWRNLGSRLANWTADLVLDKPKGLYLSSFRCLRRAVAQEIIKYDAPFPYVDGLISQVTSRYGSLKVEHLARAEGRSNYTIAKLIRLWLMILINFSVLPLRASAMIGFLATGTGTIGIFWVLGSYLIFGISVPGYYSMLVVILFFSGLQALILGVIGEYMGHMYLSLNKKPQAVVREVVRSKGEPGE